MTDEVVSKHHSQYDAIYGQDNPETPAGGWIQWKGTDVCVDLHCICGSRGHHDGDFFYAVRCSDCGRSYAVGQNIKLIPLDETGIAPEEWIHGDSFNAWDTADAD